MNQKVDTKLGVVIIIIITITIGAFLLAWEKNESVIQENGSVMTPQNVTTAQLNNQYETGTQTIQKDLKNKPILNISDPLQYLKGVGFYGTFNLTGYIEIQHRVCKQGDMCTKTVDYAFLIINSTDNNSIYDFLRENKGNAFVGDNSVGLGCYDKENNQIYSVNYGDNGKFENIINGSDIQKLLRSNINNPVKMRLAKPNFTGGSGAPECYSHFRQFTIL